MESENKKPSNPSAFPYVLPSDEKKGWDAELVDGMTLRDYFANSAMQVVLTKFNRFFTTDESEFDGIAKASYRIADAMLKQREL